MIAQPRRQPATSPLAARAQQLGLTTLDACRRERAAQRDGWGDTNRKDYPPGPQGATWYCAQCDSVFWSASGARKHERTHAHPVLRADWLEW